MECELTHAKDKEPHTSEDDEICTLANGMHCKVVVVKDTRNTPRNALKKSKTEINDR